MSFDQLTTNYINTPDSSVSYWDICDLIDWNEGLNRESVSAKYDAVNFSDEEPVIGRDYYTPNPDNSGTFDPSAHFLPRNVLAEPNTTEDANQWNKNTGYFTIRVSGIYDISWRFRYGDNNSEHKIRLVIRNNLDTLSRYVIFSGESQNDDVIVGSTNIYLEKNHTFCFDIQKNVGIADNTIKILFNAKTISCSGFTVVRYR
tara:strand:- start:163 stop:768 length:606 start_codon:yes stop_codon:yes gene_type:complete